MIRLPYKTNAWVNAVSSNVVGFGVRGEDLIVVFKGGGAYKYPALGDMFQMLYEAESVGKVVAKYVRNQEFVKLTEPMYDDGAPK